jgi:hypothetical protein
MKNKLVKLAIANLAVSLFMLFMLLVAEIMRVQYILGIFIGIFWVLLDLTVLTVSSATAFLLWKYSDTM